MSEFTASHRSLDIAVFGARTIPSTYSGYETFLNVLLPDLVDRGHRVTMYVREGRGRLEPYRGVERIGLPSIETKSLDTISHGLVSAAGVAVQRPDVALAVNLANIPMVYSLRKMGIPTAINVDGQEWLRGKWGPSVKKMWHRAAQAAQASATAVITDCNGMGDLYRNEFDCDSTVIPYCWTDITEELTDDALRSVLAKHDVTERNFFVVAGRLNPENNIERTVESFLRSERSETLLVLGAANYDSPTATALAELAATNDRLRLVGHVADREEFGGLLAGAAGYIHGHSVGGINPSLLEAMGSGALCLCFGTPFNREAVGDAGHVFDDFDSGLVTLLNRLDTRGAESNLLRKGARHRVDSEYSRDEVVSAYEATLLQAASVRARESIVVDHRWVKDWRDRAVSPLRQGPFRPHEQSAVDDLRKAQ